MALTKTITDDKLEVVGDFKDLQIRTATVIKEDGTELSRSFHRRVLQCVSSVNGHIRIQMYLVSQQKSKALQVLFGQMQLRLHTKLCVKQRKP